MDIKLFYIISYFILDFGRGICYTLSMVIIALVALLVLSCVLQYAIWYFKNHL